MRTQAMPSWIRFAILTAGLLLVQPGARAADSLEAGFQAPPDSAKPHTWWHWMNGNVTKEGITLDLEAMKHIGLGGAEIFNVGSGIPAGPVKFNSPEWHEMFAHAVREAGRLGLELEVHNCAGWSSSGGPWNVASNAMMRVVTSELKVTGPTNFSGALPQPSVRNDFYRDIAVLAFPTLDGEGAKRVRPKVTTSVAEVDAAGLGNGGNAKIVTLPLPTAEHPQFFQLEFPQPFTARTVQLTPGTGTSNARGVIQSSSDGVNYRECGQFSLSHRPTRPMIFSLGNEAVTARFYRVVFNSLGSDAKEISLRGIELSPRLRIENFETKDGDTGGFVEAMSSDNRAADGYGLNRSKTADLTGKLEANGKLNWEVPEGEWTILRIGFTPTGRENHPAPPEGTGLECDKFSQAALDAHWAGFMQKVITDAGPWVGKSFIGSVVDSYEMGGQNWTPNFREEFKQRRGYDATPFLAAFTGRVVDSPEMTERFLWDVRRTVADLFADNYYTHFAQLCHSNGLIASIEPYTGPFESLQCGQPADIVMGEFWSGSQGHASVKLAASVAHIYGKKIVGAESFTAAPGPQHGRWLEDPYSLKALGDLEYCAGLNRYIFHRYAMQPWTNRLPGMTMGQWGFHFERTSTWWEQGKSWIDYCSRCQFLLQEGRYVADAAYFNGESSPSEMREGHPPLPAGYEFDAVNADVLLHHARVENGRLNLDGGASYAVLILPPEDVNMKPVLLARIAELVRAGLTVVGAPPQHSPSLENYPECDAEVKVLAKQLWGRCDGKNVTENTAGKGRIAWGRSLTNIFEELNLGPDFTFAGREEASKIVYCHRQTGEADIYFVSNQRQRFDSADCSFRVTGKVPELWNPETGSIQPAAVWREEKGRTVVSLQFEPAGSMFVVFRNPASGNHFVSIKQQPKATGTGKVPELKIISAAYGYFPPTGQPWTDVTGKVKELVGQGTWEIPANNDFAGNDPAPDVIKQLRVEFTLNGQARSETADEDETLTLPKSAVVTKAVYGKLAAKMQSADVTKKLTSLITGGELSARVNNSLAGADPADKVPKELRVEYSLGGVTNHLTVRENEMLRLPETASSLGSAPACEISAGENGAATIRAFAAGDYELLSAAGKVAKVSVGDLPDPLELGGDWQVQFPPGLGAPDSMVFNQLISWSNHTNPGVKYFSGTAVYEKEIEIPAEDVGAGGEVWLDLGAVKNFAEVSLNGKSYGVLWKPPFRVNVTEAARAGKNSLQVKVTNLWPNRLIGDEQLPDDREWNGKQLKAWPQWFLEGKPSPTGRLTFTTWHHWTKDDALVESGLLGPVTLKVVVLKTVRAE